MFFIGLVIGAAVAIAVSIKYPGLFALAAAWVREKAGL